MPDIDQNTLEEWIATQAMESETLEFKAILPVATDEKSKSEFLKDVSAMANANGGIIVYGIGEKEGQANGFNPINESIDGAIRRLEQCMQGGIEPRLTGIKFKDIPLSQGGFVLTIIVPRSFSGPHRVIFKGKSTFYLRSHGSIAEYSYSQLREAFTLRVHAEDKIRAWRAERLVMIKAGRTPIPVWKEARYVVHILPLVSFSGNSTIDPRIIDRNNRYSLLGEMRSIYRDFYNLDGLVLATGNSEKACEKYVQLFRTGAFETAGFAGSSYEQDERKFIPAFRLFKLRGELISQLTSLLAIGIVGPVGVGLSLLTVRGYKIGQQEATSVVDRDDLELPEIWAESIEELIGNIDSVVRPLFDMLWQCFNEQGCIFYNIEGDWSPPR